MEKVPNKPGIAFPPCLIVALTGRHIHLLGLFFDRFSKYVNQKLLPRTVSPPIGIIGGLITVKYALKMETMLDGNNPVIYHKLIETE